MSSQTIQECGPKISEANSNCFGVIEEIVSKRRAGIRAARSLGVPDDHKRVRGTYTKAHGYSSPQQEKLGGKKRLTEAFIKKLTIYYGLAIRRN
ncbi:unnamed protein product [Arctia plantaginis]|uniref:Uncharacterized protein n=1 Tax=Arctia plantaginis TaxID=874455 RepID=A0A8S0Z9B4_ARCPL|nr:unnamed protein product [Arctia plantaginis]